MGMKKSASHKSHSAYMIETVNKTGEWSSQIYDILTSLHTCVVTIHFCMGSSGV